MKTWKEKDAEMKKKIVSMVSGLTGILIGAGVTGYFSEKISERKSKEIDKFKQYNYILNQWLILKQEGKFLEKYFIDNNYSSIAIYGMGEMGNRLYDELMNTSITVKYAIDKAVGSIYTELDVLGIEDELEEVDVIVVTPAHAFDSIAKSLKDKVGYPIISIEDVVFEA